MPAWFVSWLVSQVNLQQLAARAREFGPQHLELLRAVAMSSALDNAPAASRGGRKLLARAPEVDPGSEVMSTREAADVLGISRRAVSLACAEERLSAVQIDGEWRIARTDVDAYRPRRTA